MDGVDDNPNRPVTLADIQVLLNRQTVAIETKLSDQLTPLYTELNTLVHSFQSMSVDIHDLKERTNGLESTCERLSDRQDVATASVEELRKDLIQLQRRYEDELDKLESFSRRDNLRFFGVAETYNESFETCATKMVELLQGVTRKSWSKDDIVRAHRIGKQPSFASVAGNRQSKPRPMIVKFAKWQDKMDILTKGRDVLKKKGVDVAGDLTSRQQARVKEYRDKGQRAYYRGNKFHVGGSLQQHHNDNNENNNNNQRHGRDGRGHGNGYHGRRSNSMDDTSRKSPVNSSSATQNGGGSVGGPSSGAEKTTAHLSRSDNCNPRQNPSPRLSRSQSSKRQRISSSEGSASPPSSPVEMDTVASGV